MQVPRPAPATVIASVALFVALGGTGYAVTALPRDSVGSPQLRAGAVKESDLGNRSVVSGKLADQTVTNAKLARGAVTGDRVAPETLGAAQIDESTLGRVPSAAEAGHAVAADRATLADRVEQAARASRADSAERADKAAFADAATHADRADRAGIADGLAHVVRKEREYSVPTDPGYYEITVTCDAGTLPTGGGYTSAADSDFPIAISSGPSGVRSWLVELLDIDLLGSPDLHGTAYAICVSADGA